MILDVGDLKTTRERLCTLQNVLADASSRQEKELILPWIEKLIDQIDVFRPLGPNGKHGNRHTMFCGCPDIPQSPVPELTIEVFFDRAQASVMEAGNGETDL